MPTAPSSAPPREAEIVDTPQRHRRHYREKLQRPAYVNLDSSNGGVVYDLNENGLGLHAVAALHAERPVHLRLELPSPHLRVELQGRVAWAEPNGHAGIEFLQTPARSRRLLRHWIFAQLLSRAHEASRMDSIFNQWKRSGEASELSFSGAERPAIPVEAAEEHAWSRRVRVKTFSTAAKPVARLFDGLVLLASLMIFLLVATAITRTMFPLRVILALSAAVGFLFGALYWGWFVVWRGSDGWARLGHSKIVISERERFR